MLRAAIRSSFVWALSVNEAECSSNMVDPFA